jgi:hypothetical protein
MESRLEPARRRAGTAKRALTGAAAIGFAAALLLARASHPGHTASPASSPSSSSSAVIAPTGDGYDGSDGGFSYEAPQVQTHVS